MSEDIETITPVTKPAAEGTAEIPTSRRSPSVDEGRDEGRAVTRRPRESGVRRFFGFIGWLLTGFGLIPALLRRKDRRFKSQEVTVYSAHRAFDLWALILTGFIGGAVLHHWSPPDHPNPTLRLVFGWIYVWVLLYSMLTFLFDVGMFRLLIWAGLFMLVWMTSKYIEAVRQVPVLSSVLVFLASLHPELNAGFAKVMSWLLLVPWVCALFLTFTYGRKRFTPNEIAEWHVGEGSELTDRSGLKFRTRYRDILESILGFGAGDLIVSDGTGREVKKYENVLFLMFLWPRLDEVLHERSALVDNASDDPVEVEEQHRKRVTVEDR